MIRQYDDVGLDLIADIRDAILNRERFEPRFAASMNVGGWRSNETIFFWDVHAVRELRDRIAVALVVPKDRLTGWAVINRDGNHHLRHNHRRHNDGHHVSGIYYVDPGGLPSARTLFESADGEIAIIPQAGRLASFPSTAWHRVEEHRGGSARITIGFDVR